MQFWYNLRESVSVLHNRYKNAKYYTQDIFYFKYDTHLTILIPKYIDITISQDYFLSYQEHFIEKILGYRGNEI